MYACDRRLLASSSLLAGPRDVLYPGRPRRGAGAALETRAEDAQARRRHGAGNKLTYVRVALPFASYTYRVYSHLASRQAVLPCSRLHSLARNPQCIRVLNRRRSHRFALRCNLVLNRVYVLRCSHLRSRARSLHQIPVRNPVRSPR